MKKRRVDEKPTEKMDLRDFGELLQGEARRIALKLEEYGADAPRYLWTTAKEKRSDEEFIAIPAGFADMLHAVILSLVPRPLGRPPKKSTTAAHLFVKHKKLSKRKAARAIAKALGEKPENIRRALRQKPKPRKPRS